MALTKPEKPRGGIPSSCACVRRSVIRATLQAPCRCRTAISGPAILGACRALGPSQGGLEQMDAAGVLRGLYWALALLLLVLLYLGLDPLEFRPANRVQWLTDGPGLAFEGRGLVLGESPIEVAGAGEDGFAIALDITATGYPQSDLGVILWLEDGRSPPPLIVAQWKDALLARIRRADGDRYWELDGGDLLPVGARREVVLRSSEARGTAFEVDGVVVARSNRPVRASDSSLVASLVLGAASNGSASWSGELRSLSFHRGDGLSLAEDEGQGGLPEASHRYVFAAGRGERVLDQAGGASGGPALLMHRSFVPPVPDVFGVPARDHFGKRWFRLDLLKNVLGFVPLGLIVSLIAWLRGMRSPSHAFLLGLGLGIGLSAFIEAVQIWIPARTSSMVDLVINALGSGLGALLVVLPWSLTLGAPERSAP